MTTPPRSPRRSSSSRPSRRSSTTSTSRRWPNARAVLVHGVLRALVESDAVRAREIAVEDDEIDRLYHATFDEVVELMRHDPANVERGTRIVIASHYLERIGDRATNIAEDVVYLVTGDVEDLNP